MARAKRVSTQGTGIRGIGQVKARPLATSVSHSRASRSSAASTSRTRMARPLATSVSRSRAPRSSVTTASRTRIARPLATSVSRSRAPRSSATSVSRTRMARLLATSVSRSRAPRSSVTTASRTHVARPLATSVSRSRAPRSSVTTASRNRVTRSLATSVSRSRAIRPMANRNVSWPISLAVSPTRRLTRSMAAAIAARMRGIRCCAQFGSSQCVHTSTGHTESNHLSMAFSPDGQLLAACNGDEDVFVWSTTSGHLQLVYIYECSSDAIELSWHPTGDRLVVSTSIGSVIVIDLPE